MADIIVTTLLDELAETDPVSGAFTGDIASETADGGGLSLREAVQLAQNGDRILFADDLNGTMRIASGYGSLGITTNVSILGDDRITISGDVAGDDVIDNGLTNALATRVSGNFSDNSKIFYLTNSATNVALDGLTLTGGRGVNGFGGAVDAFLSGLTVEGSTFAGNISYGGYGGGAIYTSANLTVEDSAFFDNIAVDGTNTAVGHGGGAIFSKGGDLSVRNTTFAENQALNGTNGTAASGGAIFADGDVYLNNVTITGNQSQFQGGGLFATNGPLVEQEPGVFVAEDDVAIFNSIILGNNANVTGPGANNELDGYDLTAFTIENSITSNADGAVTGVFAETQTVNVTNGVSTFTAGVLADNGGPVQTVALLNDPLNPAIGGGGLNARLGDARGIASFGERDLGAYELIDDANLVVTSLEDGINAADGVITLREAVLAANGRYGADFITFANDLSGIVRLTEGALEVSDSLFLYGEGRITISGDTAGDDTIVDDVTDLATSTEQALENNTRIFDVTATSGIVAVDGLTFTGGRAEGEGNYANVDRRGGAIRVLDEDVGLYISDSSFAGNVAAGAGARGGAIFTNGDVQLLQSEFVDNLADGAGSFSRGGAVASADGAEVTIRSSFFGDNSAVSGGGAVAGGIITASNSTFTGNSLTDDEAGRGGAILGTNADYGYQAGNAVTLINSTVTGNTIASDDPRLSASGVAGRGDVTLINSIVLGNVNTAAGAPGTEIGSFEGAEGGFPAPVTLEGFNIIGADSGGFTGSETAGSGSYIAVADVTTVFAETEDNNGVLAGVASSNGGTVMTVALNAAAANPALDASVGDTVTRSDARGVAAVGIRDLGAYEAPGPESFVVTTLGDGPFVSEGVTLRAAIAAANGQDGANTITFAEGLAGRITLTQGELAITDSVTILGDGRITISGDANGDDILDGDGFTDVDQSKAAPGDLMSDNSRIFVLTGEENTSVLDGLTLTGGRAVGDTGTNDGGAVYANVDAITISNSTITGNYAENEGGGVYIYADSAVTLTSATITNNRAADDGGGVYAFGDDVMITNSTISGNTAEDEGGGVFIGSVETATLTSATITNNSAESDGGGVYIGSADTATLTAVTITDNRSESDGGGVYSNADTTTITGSNISRNRLDTPDTGTGGGVYADGALRIVSSTIAYNEIVGEDPFGGGVYNGGVSTEIISSTIVGNRTTGDLVDFPGLVSGAGVYADYAITVTDSIIVGNIASSGGPDISEYAEADGGEGDGIITFTGQNIIGANAAGYDASGLANVRNGSLADLFSGGLADNGGPVQTIALSSQLSNPALDATTTTTPDARGVARVDLPGVNNGGVADLGAFELEVSDDDVAPVFTSQAFISVGETLLSGLNLVPVEATDLTAVTFSIAGGADAGAVSIDGSTGVLSIPGGVDFENPSDANGDNRFDIVVRARDQAGNVTDQNVTIQITDVDEPPTITSSAAFTAAENQTTVGAVMASDDKAGATFAITGGADAALFSINAANGALRFNAAPNFEAPADVGGNNAYNLQVTVTDSGGQTTAQSITVTVTDVNEAPVATNVSASGDEDTVISGALAASDVDGDNLTFTALGAPSNGSVTVNPNGAFTFTPDADFNGTDSFTFRVSDGALTDTGTATITVNPVDEPVNPPNPTDPPGTEGPFVGATDGDDTLIGTAQNDTINALAGDDDVRGLAGDDALTGAAGNDSILGGGGDDRLTGSRGDDTLKGGGGVDTLNGNGGEDQIRGNGGGDVIRGGGGVDDARGGGGADQIFGGGGADVIRGNGGGDTLRGNGGADDVNGGGGSDLIFGGGGADRLSGAGGADTLRGDGGNDTLIGGNGRDVFQFRASDRMETIQDFRQGQDRIEIQTGANGFDALDIDQDGADVLISFGSTEIRVVTDNAAAFDEDDFIF